MSLRRRILMVLQALGIKKTVSGQVIAVDDVSSIEHQVECKIETKNVYKPPKPGYTSEIPGTGYPKLEVFDNGRITITGTATITGGRNTIVTPSFSLPAGTWVVSYAGKKDGGLFLVNEISKENLVTENIGGTFTLTMQTPLHFGVNTWIQPYE